MQGEFEGPSGSFPSGRGSIHLAACQAFDAPAGGSTSPAGHLLLAQLHDWGLLCQRAGPLLDASICQPDTVSRIFRSQDTLTICKPCQYLDQYLEMVKPVRHCLTNRFLRLTHLGCELYVAQGSCAQKSAGRACSFPCALHSSGNLCTALVPAAEHSKASG